MRRSLDVLRCREVWLARAEIDDVDALAAQPIGFSRHPKGWRCDHSAHAMRNVHWRPFDPLLARRRSSTSGGTSPSMAPPSMKTSLIRRELM